MKQTAVDFLIEEIECRGIVTKELRLAFKQAKEMEKQQIITAYNKAVPFKFGKQYYNETYLSQQDKP
jgi:hypothetical protein